MTRNPYIRVSSFTDAQRNFEALSTSITVARQKITALEAGLAGKIDSVTASDGVTFSGTSSVVITIDPTKTTAGVVPSATNKFQLSGYRVITAGAAGTSAGNPIQIDDFYVELASTASTVTAIYLPAYNATGQFAGKIYIVRNGKNKPITLNGVFGVAKTTATTAPIGAGYAMMVVNTGTKWRSIGEFRTGNTLGNVA